MLEPTNVFKISLLSIWYFLRYFSSDQSVPQMPLVWLKMDPRKSKALCCYSFWIRRRTGLGLSFKSTYESKPELAESWHGVKCSQGQSGVITISQQNYYWCQSGWRATEEMELRLSQGKRKIWAELELILILEMSRSWCQRGSLAFTEEAGADDEEDDEWSLSCVRVEPTR